MDPHHLCHQFRLARAADVPGQGKLPGSSANWERRSFPNGNRPPNVEITSVSFSADGKKLLSSSFDKTVRLWDVQSGRELQSFRGPAPGPNGPR
jgi:WD40 repeat protein